jgi:hypothetical protein
VGRDGFEPSTNWLKANCSTAELTPQKRVRIILREKKNSSNFIRN